MTPREFRLACRLANLGEVEDWGVGNEVDLVEFYDQKYSTKVGSTWNGLTVTDVGYSWDSVSATFDDYEELPGIREVPYSDFTAVKKGWFYAAGEWERTRKLAVAIKRNQRIEPLIIGAGKKGPFILEGQHRFVALRMLKMNLKSFPAVVVVDLDD